MFSTNKLVKKLVTLGVLSALGIPLMLIEIPTFTPWLKFDLSDIVVYLSAIIFGPVSAILVAFVKSLIHFFVKGSAVGVPIDQVIAFLSSLAYALPLYYITIFIKKKFNTTSLVSRLVPVVLSSLIVTIIMTFLNYIYLTELYLSLYGVDDIVGYITNTDYGLGFMVPNWIIESKFLPNDTYFWFIIIIYVPFNLIKAGLLSAVFMLLSYRLDYIIQRFDICEDGACPILLDIEE